MWHWHFRKIPPLCIMVAAWLGILDKPDPEEESGDDWIREDMVRRANAS